MNIQTSNKSKSKWVYVCVEDSWRGTHIVGIFTTMKLAHKRRKYMEKNRDKIKEKRDQERIKDGMKIIPPPYEVYEVQGYEVYDHYDTKMMI